MSTLHRAGRPARRSRCGIVLENYSYLANAYRFKCPDLLTRTKQFTSIETDSIWSYDDQLKLPRGTRRGSF